MKNIFIIKKIVLLAGLLATITCYKTTIAMRNSLLDESSERNSNRDSKKILMQDHIIITEHEKKISEEIKEIQKNEKILEVEIKALSNLNEILLKKQKALNEFINKDYAEDFVENIINSAKKEIEKLKEKIAEKANKIKKIELDIDNRIRDIETLNEILKIFKKEQKAIETEEMLKKSLLENKQKNEQKIKEKASETSKASKLEEYVFRLSETLGIDSQILLQKIFIENKISPDFTFSPTILWGNTPIIFKAIDSKHLEFFQWLIKNGANINITDKLGFTPLHRAITGLSDIPEFELKQNEKNAGKAIYYSSSKSVKSDDQKEDYSTAILHVPEQKPKDPKDTKEQKIEISKKQEQKIKITEKDYKKLTDISEYNKNLILSLEFIKILIEMGADLNIQDSAGQTPLHILAIISNKNKNTLFDQKIGEIAELMIKNGANPKIEDNNKKIPRNIANQISIVYKHLKTEYIDEKIGKKLSESFIKDNDSSEEEFIKLMEENSLNQNSKFNRLKILKDENEIAMEEYILSLAVEKRKIKIFNYLIGKNANVNAANKDGLTPLHFAVKFNGIIYPEESAKVIYMIETLLSKGADINLQDENGNRPIDLQINKQFSEIYKYLYSKTENSILNNLEKIKKIISKKENIDQNKKDIIDALFFGAAHANKKIIEKALNLGKHFDININVQKTSSGLTLLHTAIISKKNTKKCEGETYDRYDEIIKFLIKNDADPKIKNNGNKDAFDLLGKEEENLEIIKFIRDYELSKFYAGIKDKN